MATPSTKRPLARRSQGLGSLKERPAGSGTWQGKVFVGRNEAGKPVYKTVTIKAPSRSAADVKFSAWCSEIRAAYGAGSHSTEPLLEEVETFGALLRYYFEALKPQWTSGNRRTHEDYIDGYLAKLGKLAPRQITPRVWDRFCSDLLTKGGITATGRQTKTKSGRLAPETIERMETMVRAAFNYAIETGVFKGSNPLNDHLAKKWKTQVVELCVSEMVAETNAEENHRVPESWEVVRLVEAAPTLAPDLAAFVALAASNGPRRGELMALTLRDWDPGRREMQIARRLVAAERGGKETIVLGTKDGGKKGFPPRVVPVSPDTAAALNTHIERCQLRAVVATDPATFGRLCAAGRRAKGMTQAQVGAAVGISQVCLSLLERGHAFQGRGTVAPGPASLGALAAMFGLRWEELCPGGALAPNAFLFSPAPDGSSHWALRSGGEFIAGLVRQIDVEPFGLQGLRRRVSSDLVRSGATAPDLMALMGHSYAVAIRYYAESTSVTRAAAMAHMWGQSRTEPGPVVALPLRKEG